MKKQDLVEVIASKTGETKKSVENIVNCVFDTIVQRMKAGEIIDIHGFGKFVTTFKEAHEGKNVRTGEVVQVAAKYTPKLRYSSTVKKIINE